MKKGFSLIEIGIVMIIIGILIAAVMKGRDVIKSAEIKQHNQTFLNKWVGVATTYYDKIGYNITGESNNSSITSGHGFSDDNASESMYGCINLINSAKEAGINLGNVIATNTGSPCRKTISGEFSGDVTVAIGFENLQLETQEESNVTRNVVLFYNMPSDVTLAFDRLIDGVANTYSGKVVVLQAYGDAIDDTNTTETNSSKALLTSGDQVTAMSNSEILTTNLHTVGVILEH